MNDVAVVFPGQGSQRAGMGADFAEKLAVSKRVFEEASAALGLDVAAICAGGPELGLTEYTQPCILTAEIAMLAGLREMGFAPARFGGHSLGEYTALVAAGAMPFDAAVRLVRLRGRLMQNAVPVGQGGMAAVIQPNLDLELVARVARDAGIDVANFNSPSQVVISGSTEGLQRATAELTQAIGGAGGRVVALEVSAPFHSRALAVIEGEFRAALDAEAARFDAPRARAVTSNFTGGFHAGDRAALVDALTRQISGSVRWIDNMKALADGAGAIFEVGPNRPLMRFFKELGHEVTAIINLRGADKIAASRGAE
jgi:[acyl-carrier-protein] S-malonyltransferase/trans-AT polyketide synthase/acyltransferase/oxidoreductase domain-containing protein